MEKTRNEATTSNSDPAVYEDPARRQFTDGDGRQWPLRLDFDAVDEIRDQFQIDFGDVVHYTQQWAQLLWDDQLSLKLIWFLIRDNAGDVTEKSWRKSMDGERLEEARDALLGAIFFFTPPTKKQLAIKATASVTDFYRQAIREAETKMAQTVDETIERFEKTHGTTASKSPVSSARYRGATRSATRSRR